MTHLINISAVNNALALSAIRTIFVACIATLGLAAFRPKATSLRLFVWKSVLVAAIAMPLLGQLVPPVLFPAPEFLRNRAPSVIQQDDDVAATIPVAPNLSRDTPAERKTSLVSKSSSTNSEAPGAITQPVSARPSSSLQINWGVTAAAIYCTVTLIFLIRFILGTALSRKLVRASRRIPEPRLHQRVASQAKGLGATPQFAESDLISVPVTVGALRSTVLLPRHWREWDDAQLDAVIAHEVSHVVRRDALTQHVSLVHRAIFWFSPFAWWLERHLGALAEQASDEAALACGADRNDYARTLLGFFEALETAPGRVWWQGVSMATAGQAEQRLERILAWKGSITMNLKKSILVAIVLFAIPVVYLAASVRPTTHVYANGVQQAPQSATGAQLQPPAVPSAVPAMPAAPPHGGIYVSVPAPVGVVAPAAPVGPVGAVAPSYPVTSVAPYAPFGQSSERSSERGYSYAYGYDDEDRFIIVSGKSDSFTMSGSMQDIHHVERLKKQINGDFIWFQRDEKSYIIRDQATIDRAKAFWAPQEELGKKQEELGKQQEALGKQQEELGLKMEQVRVNVPDMAATLDALKAKLQKLGPSATMEQIGDLQEEIGELQSKIGGIQSQAGEQQSKLGEQQGMLGEKQGKLGEQQGRLGEQQAKLAQEAVKKTKALFDECIKDGKAKPEQGGSDGASL